MFAMHDSLVADSPSGWRESELTQGVKAVARHTKMSQTQANTAIFQQVCLFFFKENVSDSKLTN